MNRIKKRGDLHNFKQTEIGRLPKEWEVVRLEEIFDIQVGGDIYKLNFSKQKNERYKFPIYSNSLENNGLYGYADTYQYPENCITVTGRGTLGRATPRFEKFNAIIRLLVLIPKANINIMFASEYINTRIGFRIEKTSIPQLTAPKLAKYKIPLPPLPEQKKIAEILSTVDEAIEKVDESIAKTERLKKGLMQELLTKGIGHKEFKDTEIGRIPKEWEVVRLESLINEVKKGFASGKRDENGIVQIRMNNVTTDGLLILDSYLKVPVPDNVNDWILEDGDFLFNNTNSYDLVGKSTIFKGVPFPCTFSNHFTRIRFRNNLVLPEIILYHFLILWEKGYFKSVAIRHVGQSAVHTKYLLKLKLPLPPLPEQQKIAEILSTVDKRLVLLRNKKEKMERIKKGLMNDLLTGKRRVKV